ncbi:FdhE protein [Salmonella enterica subsp. salamae]|nr:FdhE protein [Salmonella enterica subsp. salamae]
MSIRIIPQDELGSSEKRTADMIPPLLFPRLKNVYNRRAERLRELAENNRWAITCALPRLSRTRRKWCCTTIRWSWI